MAEWKNDQERDWMYGVWEMSHTLYVTLRALADYEFNADVGGKRTDMDYQTLFGGLSFMAAAIEYNMRSIENGGPIDDVGYDFERIERMKKQLLSRKQGASDQAEEAESED